MNSQAKASMPRNIFESAICIFALINKTRVQIVSRLFRRTSPSHSYLNNVHCKMNLGCVILSSIFLHTFSPISLAQDVHFEPQGWFPLVVGSYWHYELEAGGVRFDIVQKATQDTLLTDQRWVAIKDYKCFPDQFCRDIVEWYHFTEDDYLLRSVDTPALDADTLFVTYPESFFRTVVPSEIQPEVPVAIYSTPLVERDVSVSFTTNSIGSEQDSTNLLMYATADGHIAFDELFVYKIGRFRNLMGAIVDGIEFGNTDLITEVVRVGIEMPTEVFDVLKIYPDPLRANGTIQIETARSGKFRLRLYNLLGQLILTEKGSLSGGENLQVNLHSITSSGTYFLIVDMDGMQTTSRTLTIIK